MAVIVNGNEVVLNGCVGDVSGGWGFEDFFTSTDVIVALAQVGHATDVVVRLNSGGGIATEGSSIHASLSRHKGKKTVVVEGIAASAASVIAMAGDEVIMSLGAVLMIHDPSQATWGTASDHQLSIASLTAVGDSMASIYAAKSGQTLDQCRADMKTEVWLTADQAVAKGYADRAEGSQPVEAQTTEAVAPSAFDYTLYARAPRKIAALAKAKHWTKPPAQRAEATPATPPAKADEAAMGETMTEAEMNEKLAEARAAGVAEANKTHEAAAKTSLSRADASEIARLCADGGVPTMTATLLAEGASIADAKTRINLAGETKSMVALARKANPAIPATMEADLIAKGSTVEQTRAALFDHLVAKSEEQPLASHHRAAGGGTDHAASTGGREKSKANMEALVKKTLPPKKEG